ncbi:WcaI family glycosyltransferase [Flavihumibacter sp. R14]|nr:WcaI family glycosyltransferase [Flavihumibacter soli]
MKDRDDRDNRILVIGINCLPELTGIGRYTGEMVTWFADNGYECNVVTTFPYYPYWEVQKPYWGKFYKKEVLKDGRLTLYRCPFYVPGMPSGLKRLIHEASFFLSAFFMIVMLLFKPGHKNIYCIAPPFHLGFLAVFYRFFKGGRIIYHVQDLQIEAARDLKILKPEWIFSFLFRMEKYILSKADHISTISAGMVRKKELKIDKEVSLFPNWVDTLKFHPIRDKNIQAEWGFNAEDKIVLYSGSLGEKQGLEVLIGIAVQLRVHSHIKLVICGTGPYKEILQQMSLEAGTDNISFLPLQKQAVFNRFLNMVTVHLVIQKGGASDLVMPSKLTTILAAGGLALVTADAGTTLHDVVKVNNMGIVVPPENKEQLLAAILNACTKDYSLQRVNARAYAEQYLEKEAILHRVTQEWHSSEEIEAADAAMQN